ncbi:hypothetical protein KA005_79150 [bacterium]|nr:hypothetical protein [bacterium]
MAKLVTMKHKNGKVYLVSRIKADDLLKNHKGFTEVKATGKVKSTKENKEVESRETK